MNIRVGYLSGCALLVLLALFGLRTLSSAESNIPFQLKGSPMLRAGAEKQQSPSSGYTVLYSFCSVPNCMDGGNPLGSLVEDSAGNFYGTTWTYDGDGSGTVFKLDNTGQETVLDYFCYGNCSGGAFPRAGLIQDAAGNLYGTTWAGGLNGGGTVFKLDNTGQETVLYNFCSVANCTDGSGPSGTLIQDSAGNLYGTTEYGGNEGPNCSSWGGCGTVFKVDPATGQETVVYAFCNYQCGDGLGPQSGVVQDASGNLYGITSGPLCCGTIFKVDPAGQETVLYRFCSQPNCIDGADSYGLGGLIIDSEGNLYGTAPYGGGNIGVNRGYGGGVAFKLDITGHYAVLYNFCSAKLCRDGSSPGAGLIFGPAGKLYGTTTSGGFPPCSLHGYRFPGCGTIFELDSTGQETVLYSFCPYKRGQACLDGSSPNGLIQDATGNLYGTTVYGGTGHGYGGTVFKLAPVVTRVALTSNPNPSHVDQPVTLSATVSGSYVTPTGQVTFEKGKTVLGTVDLANGAATLTTAFTKPGKFSIRAVYSGDQIYQATNSRWLKQVVEQ